VTSPKLKESWLERQGRTWPHIWKKTWCIVRQGVLTLHKDPNTEEARATVFLKGSNTTGVVLKGKRPFGFQITDTSDGTLLLSAANAELRDEWIKILLLQKNADPLPSASTKGEIASNTGLTGRVVDMEGRPFFGLLVQAIDKELIVDDDLGVIVKTSEDGSFKITYSKWAYGLESAPDIVVIVSDPVGREVYRSDKYKKVEVGILVLEDIILPRSYVDGWLVTSPKGQVISLSQGNYVQELVDNAVAWAQLTDDIVASTASIQFTQLYLDTNAIMTKFNVSSPQSPMDSKPITATRLDSELIKASKRAVAVNIIINDFIGLPAPYDSANKVEAYIKENGGDTISLLQYRRPITSPMQAKFAIIDGQKCHIMGSSLLQENFDDSSHSQANVLRGDDEESKKIKLPIHNFSVYLEGPATQLIGNFFKQLWNCEALGDSNRPFDKPQLPKNPTEPKAGTVTVQVLRTLPWNTFDEDAKGSTEIFEAYQRAFRYASDFIYLECQYFTESKIVDSLIFALELNPKLQLIILLNKAVDVSFYQREQEKRISELLEKAKLRNFYERIGIFTAWSHEQGPMISRIIPIYINSKLGIVDNKFMTVGSANLDGLSLINSQVPLFNKADAHNTSICMNVAVYSDVNGQPKNDFPNQSRIKTWSEFLGVTESELEESKRPAEGWLSLWNTKAKEKVAVLKTDPSKPCKQRILTYVPKPVAIEYLAELGIKENLVQIDDQITTYLLSKRKWEPTK
jgi:phosphatidylserine/phosphatidylglycerophosphate/cardiolipin synthase-like enzyme